MGNLEDLKNLSVDEVLEIIKKVNGEPCIIKDAIISSGEYGYHFGVDGLFFQNITFENCLFNYPNIRKCIFRECKFIKCQFFDAVIFMNKFELCDAIDIVLDNNTHVDKNIFDGLRGNLKTPDCLSNSSNYFKNMDFSGFLKLYESSRWGEGAIVWFKNYFVNTTVELSAIEKLAKLATYIWTGDRGLPIDESRLFDKNGYPIYDYELNPFSTKKTRKPVAFEGFKATNFLIDVQNMDENKRVNLLANLVVNLPEGYAFDINKREQTANLSRVHLYSKPNPLPIHIIDSRVNKYSEIKNSAIKPINLNIQKVPDKNYPLYSIYDGRKIDGYTEEHNLYNPSNYEPYGKKLILTHKK